jgi:hypothetical protein
MEFVKPLKRRAVGKVSHGSKILDPKEILVNTRNRMDSVEDREY